MAAASSMRREELERSIRVNSRFLLVGSVAGVLGLAIRARTLRPDVALLDLPEPRTSFPSLTTDLEQAGVAVVVLVDEPDASWTARALRAGLRAVLPRDASAADIHSAIEAANRGMLLLDAELARELFPPIANRERALEDIAALEDLTPREIEVLRMMAEGLGNKEIAARLAISDHTVKFHISSILAKLGASTRTEAVTTGIRMGLILL